jgi:citrate lyase gamma subunit
MRSNVGLRDGDVEKRVEVKGPLHRVFGSKVGSIVKNMNERPKIREIEEDVDSGSDRRILDCRLESRLIRI